MSSKLLLVWAVFEVDSDRLLAILKTNMTDTIIKEFVAPYLK